LEADAIITSRNGDVIRTAKAAARRPLHLQVSYVDSELAKIITLYEPNPAEWYDYERRR